MSQVEELKEFISQRLHAATSEILGAVVKSLSDFEEQTVRLKEENRRLRSVLDIIVESKEAAREPKIIRRPENPTRRSAAKHQPKVLQTSGAKGYVLTPKSKCLFTSREDLLKVQDENGNCPYCIKTSEATETHLLRRHYSRAIHFTTGGTDNFEKFVIPCMCKDKIQGRSHWHCPCCQKIIYRTCNFEAHLSKMHGYVTQQQPATNQLAASVIEAAPLNNEPRSQQQPEQHRLLMLQIKQETDQVTHPEVQVSVEPVQNGDGQTGGQSLERDYDQELMNSIVCVDSFIQDISEIRDVHNPPSQPMVTDAWCETSVSGGSQHTAGKRAVAVNVGGSQTEGSTQLSSSGNPTGSHSCKARGKVFSHAHTPKAHVQTHAKDKKRTREKRLKPSESLARHLQGHSKRNECIRCRKLFSCSSRLKRHMKFHSAKVLNAAGKGLQV